MFTVQLNHAQSLLDTGDVNACLLALVDWDKEALLLLKSLKDAERAYTIGQVDFDVFSEQVKKTTEAAHILLKKLKEA